MNTLMIHSSKRLAGGTLAEFTVELDRSVEGVWRVVYASIPNTVPTATGTVTVNVGGGGDQSVSVVPAYYTPTTFASHLESQLQTLDADFNCTYDATSGTLAVTHASSAFTLSGDAALESHLTISGTQTSSGLTETVQTGVLNLATLHAYHISLGDLTGVRTTDGRYSSIIVPVQHGVDHSVYQSKDWGAQLVRFRNRPKRLTLTVTDAEGAAVDLRHDWLVVLQQ